MRAVPLYRSYGWQRHFTTQEAKNSCNDTVRLANVDVYLCFCDASDQTDKAKSIHLLKWKLPKRKANLLFRFSIGFGIEIIDNFHEKVLIEVDVPPFVIRYSPQKKIKRNNTKYEHGVQITSTHFTIEIHCMA